jgi:hypothetical protein
VRHRCAVALALGITGAVVVAASFTIASTLAYDPWAWLVWGREVGQLDLATTGGPSWKPLPVLPATLIAPLGDAAPTAWSALVRALSLVTLAGVFQLARRLSGSVVAGLVAAGLLVLTPDHGPRFLRTVLEGHTAALTAGLAAWAVERHLAGRHGTTFWLLVALALDRPEAWPFLGAYALWGWRTDHVRTAALCAGLAAVPVLWFGGDWWGAGSPLHGAGAAQDVPDSFRSLAGALDRAVASVITPVWLAALGGTAVWLRRRDEGPLGGVAALTGLALAWMATVLLMNAALDYAALSRFYLPAAALLCAAAAVAAAEAVAWARPGAARWAMVGLLVVVTLPAAIGRASNLPALLDEVEARGRAEDCTDGAIAWRSDVALDDIGDC